MLDLLVGILHLVVFPGGLFALALGLFLKGCDRRVEARLQRRVGPPLIQPFLDLVKLSTKEVIIPTSAVRGAFLAAPVVALGGIAMCAALLPVPGVTDGLPKMGDLLVIFYLFPIPAMAIMLAGSSSGSPYGGIGFSREMIMMLAYEVPLLMIMLTVAMKVGGGSGAEFSLTKIMDYQAEHGSFGLTPVMWPAFLAWLMFLPATLGVPPFDQPEAETEILEGPLLEYSGVLLAFFHMASALKMVVARGGAVLPRHDFGHPRGQSGLVRRQVRAVHAVHPDRGEVRHGASAHRTGSVLFPQVSRRAGPFEPYPGVDWLLTGGRS